MNRTIGTLLAGLVCTGIAHADTVFGKVVNSSNQPVVGAKVHVSGLATPVLTNSSGLFAAVVATGTYTIGIEPPGTNMAPVQLLNVVVSVSKDLGTITLKPGFPISGKVTNQAGAGIQSANIDIVLEGQRTAIYTPNDNSDASGLFTVVVPAGVYRVQARPPVGAMLVAAEHRNVVVNAAKAVGNLVLQTAVAVTGTVVDAGTNLPLAGVDIDVDDRFGTRLLVPNDKTAANGTFSILLPVALVHLMFDPPSTSNLLGIEMLNQDIKGATNLGTIAMKTGVRLSGTVLGPGNKPVVDADIDIDTAVGDLRIYTPNDNTDATGAFSVVVPTGAFRVTVEPKKADLVVGTQTAAITVTGNTTVPTINLAAGVLLSGTITGHDGKPEVKADIDVIHPTTGAEVITGSDDTDALGKYSVVVPTGTWNVKIQSSNTSMSRVKTVNSVVISGATTLNQSLTITPIAVYFGTQGIPTVTNGTAVPAILAFANPTAQNHTTDASIVFTDPLGKETVMVGPLRLTVPRGFTFVTVYLNPIPSIANNLLGLQGRLEARFDEPVTGAEQDRSRFKFFIK